MNDFKSAVSGAEGLVHDASQAAAREYTLARRNVEGALDDAMHRLDEARRAVTKGARGAADATDGYVRDNPWTALGVAAAAGLLVGLLFHRR